MPATDEAEHELPFSTVGNDTLQEKASPNKTPATEAEASNDACGVKPGSTLDCKADDTNPLYTGDVQLHASTQTDTDRGDRDLSVDAGSALEATRPAGTPSASADAEADGENNEGLPQEAKVPSTRDTGRHSSPSTEQPEHAERAAPIAAPQRRLLVHNATELSSRTLAELDAALTAALETYETRLDKVEDEPELALDALRDWAGAFHRFVEARRQRGSHWRQHLGLEVVLLEADFESDVYLVKKGLAKPASHQVRQDFS